MKNTVLLALVGSFIAGGISGYTVRVFVAPAPNSAQEELARLELQDRQKVIDNHKKSMDSLRKALGH